MNPVLPGATIGVLGGGQLGRMFAIAARRMGYRVHTFSPDTDTPTGQVSDVERTAPYDDLDAVCEFARGVDVVTFEFENVPAAATDAVAAIVPVRPAGAVLHVSQHRTREKTFLTAHGFPVARFRVVRSLADLRAAIVELHLPAILKTADFGYDGKGQTSLVSPADAEAAWRAVGEREAVLEEQIDLAAEVSVVGARGADGAYADYGVFENAHRNHILDVTTAPAAIAPRVASDARDAARAVFEQLDAVGVMCVEFFVSTSGRLLVNEIAPRPHNSGHLTFDACVTSQFEQQVRAVCGLPLGSTAFHSAAAMANLLGDLWAEGEPDWAAACADPAVKLHLYGKIEARPGRKMGHLTALARDPGAARDAVVAARRRLAGHSIVSRIS